MTIKQYMTKKHRDCDDIYSQAENLVAKQSWNEANIEWKLFLEELEEHLIMEESVLFPQFESATGMTHGPTAVMRAEHGQMRELCLQLTDALSNQDQTLYLGLSETLMVLMQQHNMKEEQMLYPMSDQVLGDAQPVIEAMEQCDQ